MSSSKKRPKMPLGSPVVRRSVVAASLGLGACSGGSRPMPPAPPPQPPPPMVEERYEEEEHYAMPPADAGVGVTAPMPDAAPTETRDLEVKGRDTAHDHDLPPQVAPPPQPPPPMIPDRNPPPMVPPRPDPPMIPKRPKG